MKEPWIATASGAPFSLAEPDVKSVHVEDISHALSMICRFGGHVPRHYSVAEHSILVSMAPEVVDCGLELEGLLHDAHEAYVGDVVQPMKMILPDYRGLERRIARCVRVRFGISEMVPDEVKVADMRMLLTEARAFGFDWWESLAERISLQPYNAADVPFDVHRLSSPRDQRDAFEIRLRSLYKE